MKTNILRPFNIFLTIFLLSVILPQNANAQQYECEDTCNHVHGIDISHYQGEVFWETVGNNTKMAYVYIKATEGGDRIDPKYEQNLLTAHKYGLKVGSYHFYRAKTPQETQLANFVLQCRPKAADIYRNKLLQQVSCGEAGPLPHNDSTVFKP